MFVEPNIVQDRQQWWINLYVNYQLPMDKSVYEEFKRQGFDVSEVIVKDEKFDL